MKKFYYSLIAATAMLFATTSCSDDEIVSGSGNEMNVSFTVQMAGAESRAIAEGVDVGKGNMANSLMIGSAKMGVHFTILAPKCLWPQEELVELCQEYAKESGSVITLSEELSAVEGADAVYTDVWCSMGEEDKAAERVSLLRPYQVNKELLAMTGKESTIVLHCLPAVKGNEITEDVFDRFTDVIFDEAENRMHTIKAVMVATLGK